MRAGELALKPVEQQRGQQEWREVVEGPCHLDAVDAQLAAREHGAGIVDEHVDPLVAIGDLVGQPANFRQRRQIGEENIGRLAAWRNAGDLRTCRAGFVTIARDDRQRRATGGQRLRGSQADAIRGSGDDDPLGQGRRRADVTHRVNIGQLRTRGIQA